MNTLERTVRTLVLSFEELSAADRLLIQWAAEACAMAQAPYSKFKVGAAVRSAAGGVYAGCNVERCSWSQTTHAEQNAVDTMVAREGPAKIAAIAVVGGPADVRIVIPPVADPTRRLADIAAVPVPCGHCLQIIWENCFGDPDVRLIGLGPGGEACVTAIGDALPMRFGPEDLGVRYGQR